MEDVLVQVLSLCSVETLTWIQCDEGTVLGLSLVALRYLLHKHFNQISKHHSVQVGSVIELLRVLNKRQLCSTQVSDSYRLRHWKKYFLMEQYVRRCLQANLHYGVNYWINNRHKDPMYYCSPFRASYNTNNTDHDRVLTAMLTGQWDLVKGITYTPKVNLRKLSIKLKNYELFMDPTRFIPCEHRWLFQEHKPFKELPRNQQHDWLCIIAYVQPKFLRYFDLNNDEIQYLFGYFSTGINDDLRIRQAVNYLREHDLWESFPYLQDRKHIYLLYTQLYRKEQVDLHVAVKVLEDCTEWDITCHRILFMLIEWYNFPVEKLVHLAHNLSKEGSKTAYTDCLKSVLC